MMRTCHRLVDYFHISSDFANAGPSDLLPPRSRSQLPLFGPCIRFPLASPMAGNPAWDGVSLGGVFMVAECPACGPAGIGGYSEPPSNDRPLTNSSPGGRRMSSFVGPPPIRIRCFGMPWHSATSVVGCSLCPRRHLWWELQPGGFIGPGCTQAEWRPWPCQEDCWRLIGPSVCGSRIASSGPKGIQAMRGPGKYNTLLVLTWS